MGTFNTGKAPVGILAKALTGNIFIEKSLAFMNEGDKDGYNCFKHDIASGLRARSLDPSSVTANTSQKNAFKRSLSLYEDFETFDPNDYNAFWKEYQAEGQFNYETLPSNVQASLEELFLGAVANATENELINGDGTLVTGIIPQLENSALTSLDGATPTPTQVVQNTTIGFRVHGGSTAPAVALTRENIFEKFELLLENQTKSMRKRAGRKFMVSYATGDIFRAAQRLELNFKGSDISEEGNMRYAGYEIIECSEFPDDTILFCSMTGNMTTDAIQMGTSMSEDLNSVKVEKVGPFNRGWGMLLTFAIDIFVVRPEEVCFYTTTTIA